MANFKFSIDTRAFANDIAKSVMNFRTPVADATTAAMKRAAAEVKQQWRGNIAHAHFKNDKLARAVKVAAFPGRRRTSIDAAALAWWATRFGPVYEKGADIRSKRGKYMWLPMRTTPIISLKEVTPAQLEASGIKLFFYETPGGQAILATKVWATARYKSKGLPAGRYSASFLRKNQVRPHTQRPRGRRQITVNLFVGLKSVHIKKRVDLRVIARNIAGNLPTYYDDALKAD